MIRVSVRTREPREIPSVYFSEPYGDANARHSGGEWITVADADGAWQMPLVLQPAPGGARDAATPYGYGGIHRDPSLDPAQVRAAWSDAVGALAGLGVTAVFLRFSPFLPGASGELPALPGLETERVSETVSVPVADLEGAWRGLEGRARTAVRKAERAGLVGTVAPAGDELASAAHPFRVLYRATLDRLGAAPRYAFGDAYYERLAGLADGRLHLARVTDPSGAVAASALLLRDRGVLHYHLSASEPLAARAGANNLLIWTMMRWAHASGLHAVHLGGGMRPGDRLFAFKSSFGGERRPFAVGRAVVDPDRYDSLVRARAGELRCDPLLLRGSGFFPAYRAEVAHAR